MPQCVVISDCEGAKLGVVTAFMPYWDSLGLNLDLYESTLQQMDVVVTALWPTFPVVEADDLNCLLPHMSTN